MTGSTAALEELREARDRSIDAGTARVALHAENKWQWPSVADLPGSGPVQASVRIAGRAAGRVLKLAVKDFDFGRLEGEGVLDIVGRRWMLDFGSYAQLRTDGKLWHGRSGRLLSTLPSEATRASDPLWLWDLLAAVTAADAAGLEMLGGDLCTHLDVITNLARVSEATPDDVPLPGGFNRFEQLEALPVAVWLCGGQIRRIRFDHGFTVDTLDFWDFGVSVNSYDWSRLPTFRSPEEAEFVAGTRQPPVWERVLSRALSRTRDQSK